MCIIGMFTTLLKHGEIVNFIENQGAIQMVACRLRKECDLTYGELNVKV